MKTQKLIQRLKAVRPVKWLGNPDNINPGDSVYIMCGKRNCGAVLKVIVIDPSTGYYYSKLHKFSIDSRSQSWICNKHKHLCN